MLTQKGYPHQICDSITGVQQGIWAAPVSSERTQGMRGDRS